MSGGIESYLLESHQHLKVCVRFLRFHSRTVIHFCSPITFSVACDPHLMARVMDPILNHPISLLYGNLDLGFTI